MSRKHRNLLDTILNNPPTCNLHWRDVEALLIHLGAVIEPNHGARFKVTLNGHEFFFRHPSHSSELQRLDVKHLRGELLAAGIDRAEAADMRRRGEEGDISGRHLEDGV
ncbi:MAG: type II toxin-antitoxin system HicA family toxin [Betaproteobacteria bacterium]|nr:type II toxin-antitoxin system HicA family toxin [Betaproteobacteria bacterium]